MNRWLLALSLVLGLCASVGHARQKAGGKNPALDAATKSYQESVQLKLSSEKLDGLEIDSAKKALTELVAAADANVLAVLANDATKVADKLAEFGVKLERGKLEIERIQGKLKEAQSQDRAKLEQQIKDTEKDVETAKKMHPVLRELSSEMTSALLDAIDRVGKSQPALMWDGLVAGLREDMAQLAAAEEKQKSYEAELKTVTEKLPALKGREDELRDMERRGAELAARRDAGKERIAALEKLRDRRVETLGAIYPLLDKNQQGKATVDLRANLKDEVDPGLRTFSIELIGMLPVPDAFTTPIATLKRAADEHDKVEKELEPLREQYQRAMKAFDSAVISGKGMVQVSIQNAMIAARDKLQAASARNVAALRLVSASARGIGNALSKMTPEDRQKASAELLKLVKSYGDKLVRQAALTAFAKVKDEKIAGEIRTLAQKDPEIVTRLSALDVLSAMGDELTVDLCIEVLLKDADWRVRAAAMRALVDIPRKKAIPALIAAMGVEQGRLIEDAEQALGSLTGMHFNGEPLMWKDWWTKNEGSFEIGKKPAEAGVAQAKPGETGTPNADWRKQGGHVSFYGITTRSSRILFVLDRSGSMNEPATDSLTGKNSSRTKFDIAKEELMSALAGLGDGDFFNLVHYSSDVERWQKSMVKTSPESKKKAQSFVTKELEANGGTNIHDSLREAFRLAGIGAVDKAYASNVDTIFFLTDGQPTQGEVIDPEEILRRVREWNSLSKVVVHTVGVGKDHNAAFLRRLAEENGGMYVSR